MAEGRVNSEINLQAPLEIIPNSDNISAIKNWLNLQSSWGSGDPLPTYAKYAPKGVSKADLQAVFLDLKPLGVASENYDIRGYYLTALADKILQEEFEIKYPQGATEEENRKYWEEEATIQLYRPKTNNYDKFRNLGTYWNRGTLVLFGDFDKDQNIGYGMKGGKVLVKGNAGDKLGTFMNGGLLEVEGHALGSIGVGKTGGKIITHNRVPREYVPPKVKKELKATFIDQIEELIPSDFSEPGKEMEGTNDIENDLKLLRSMLIEGLIEPGEQRENPKGWYAEQSGNTSTGHKIRVSYYIGSEKSFRMPSLSLDIDVSNRPGINITMRDWRKADDVEDHQFNKHGKARRGRFFSAHINDGKATNYKGGDIIDDSHEFPTEELLTTRDGFGQAQIYELRDIIKEALSGLTG